VRGVGSRNYWNAGLLRTHIFFFFGEKRYPRIPVSQQPSPFGIDQEYQHRIEQEISRHFDNPLTRSLIENSF